MFTRAQPLVFRPHHPFSSTGVCFPAPLCSFERSCLSAHLDASIRTRPLSPTWTMSSRVFASWYGYTGHGLWVRRVAATQLPPRQHLLRVLVSKRSSNPSHGPPRPSSFFAVPSCCSLLLASFILVRSRCALGAPSVTSINWFVRLCIYCIYANARSIPVPSFFLMKRDDNF